MLSKQPVSVTTVFDGFPSHADHPTFNVEKFLDGVGAPSFTIFLEANKEHIQKAFIKKNEIEVQEGGLSEEDQDKVEKLVQEVAAQYQMMHALA